MTTQPNEPLSAEELRAMEKHALRIDSPDRLRLLATISTLTEERDAALANARTPGTVDVCAFDAAPLTHDYTCYHKFGTPISDGCNLRTCPIRTAGALKETT